MRRALSSAVVREVFPDPSPEGIAGALDELCVSSLGSGVLEVEFFHASVGSVHGLRLRDGRRVVVKVHRPDTSVEFLEAVQTVQRVLAADGFPCPEPLVGPTPLGRGVAVVESLLDRGERADPREPGVRRTMAHALAQLVARCRSLTGLHGLRRGPMTVSQGRLWPTPHDGRFDFEATTPGAEWIDRVAREARRIRDGVAAGEWVVGHADWRVEHLRFERSELSAVYDWDSVTIQREPVLVGGAAHGFTADWTSPSQRQFPTLDEALAFAADYETARGAAFSTEERRVLRAALVYMMAYTARCEHSDLLTDFGRRAAVRPDSSAVPAGTARAFLAAHAVELLDPAA
jgi:hypothetical protein